MTKKGRWKKDCAKNELLKKRLKLNERKKIFSASDVCDPPEYRTGVISLWSTGPGQMYI